MHKTLDNKVFSIGSVRIPGRVLCAPMAGITDIPYRLLAVEAGACHVTSEMISARALLHKNKKTEKMLAIHPREHPVSIQLFGSDSRSMICAAKKAEESGADIIDINLGCPVKKIMKSGSGMALLKEDAQWVKIIRAVVRAVHIPVTIKIRSGFVPGDDRASLISTVAEAEGVQGIIIHARPASQHHQGPVFWDTVAHTVDKVRVPVIANGGISCGPSAGEVIRTTGCAAVMVGRAAIGDLDVFRRIRAYLDEGMLLDPPGISERVEAFLRHVRLNVEHYGEPFGIVRLRKVMPAYFTGLPDAAAIRKDLLMMTRYIDIEGLIQKYSL